MNRFVFTIATAGAALFITFISAAPAVAEAPSTTVSVQPGDGSSIDTDGTQGAIVGPAEMARPQIKADNSPAQDRP